MQEVLDFIAHFKDAEKTFLYGCCYWFSYILYSRFKQDPKYAVYSQFILYEPVEGHFVYAFSPYQEEMNPANWHYFDVRGDVSEIYKDKQLYMMRYLIDNEPKWYAHIMRDCRDFIQPADEELEGFWR